MCLNMVTARSLFLTQYILKFKLQHPKMSVLFKITKVTGFSQYLSSFWPSLKAHRTNSQVLHLRVCKCGCLCVWVSRHSTFICGFWLRCLRLWNNISSASSTESSSWREKKEIWEISVRAFSLSPFKDTVIPRATTDIFKSWDQERKQGIAIWDINGRNIEWDSERMRQ